MSRKKLTLSVEKRLIRRAKATAKRRGTSVSRLVETFFTTLEEGEELSESEERGAGADGHRQDPGPEKSEGPSSTGYEPSDWAQRWRGAFAQEGTPEAEGTNPACYM